MAGGWRVGVRVGEIAYRRAVSVVLDLDEWLIPLLDRRGDPIEAADRGLLLLGLQPLCQRREHIEEGGGAGAALPRELGGALRIKKGGGGVSGRANGGQLRE